MRLQFSHGCCRVLVLWLHYHNIVPSTEAASRQMQHLFRIFPACQWRQTLCLKPTCPKYQIWHPGLWPRRKSAQFFHRYWGWRGNQVLQSWGRKLPSARALWALAHETSIGTIQSKLVAGSLSRLTSRVSLLLPWAWQFLCFLFRGPKLLRASLGWGVVVIETTQEVLFASAYSSLPGTLGELLVVWSEKLEAQGFPRLLSSNCSGK